jgi:hypothetical protein
MATAMLAARFKGSFAWLLMWFAFIVEGELLVVGSGTALKAVTIARSNAHINKHPATSVDALNDSNLGRCTDLPSLALLLSTMPDVQRLTHVRRGRDRSTAMTTAFCSGVAGFVTAHPAQRALGETGVHVMHVVSCRTQLELRRAGANERVCINDSRARPGTAATKNLWRARGRVPASTRIVVLLFAGPGTASGTGASACYKCAAGTAGTGSCGTCSKLAQIIRTRR